MQSKSKPTIHRGRGAVSSPHPRYLPVVSEAFDDGWQSVSDQAFSPPPQKTHVQFEQTRHIVNTNQSPDIPFSRSINPYKGCEHGCIYCFARPTHAYLDLSPGLDFETRLVAKPDAAERLRETFNKPSYRPSLIALGANTDPYQPLEREHGIARALLEVFEAFQHPVAIVTKSALVLRDLDILGRLAERRLVQVYVSVTTLDADLARRMEPRAAAPHRRMETIASLACAGVPVGVLLAPLIPGLNDAEIERIIEASRAAGAQDISTILLRLPLEIKTLFEDWLETHVPMRAGHILSLIRDTRGGTLYDARYFSRHRGQGPTAELLRARFDVARRRSQFGGMPALSIDAFQRPPQSGTQLQLAL